MLKSNWFVGCFADVSNEESDATTHLNLACSALLLLRATVRSADVLHQLCRSASGKSVSHLTRIRYLLNTSVVAVLLICSVVVSARLLF